MNTLEGQILAGRYLVKQELGRGGMAIIYTGTDTMLRRDVAIKILYPHLASDSGLMQRFINEARIIAQLNYRSIVALYDIAEHEGVPFLVLEYVHGYNLRELYERRYGGARKPAAETALLIASIVCDAVAHAHEAGIVHRDIKPENVLISDQGDLKITDFGLAHILADTRMTVSGTVIGSPEFMSPEHISSNNINTESDVFSLGSLIYWLLTGTSPFSADNTMSVLNRISGNDYERLDTRAGIDESIASIVGTCLRPIPGERYRDAGELSRALHDAIDRYAPDPHGLFKASLTGPDQTDHELTVRHNRVRYDDAVSYLRSNRFEKALSLIGAILETGDDSVDAAGLMRKLRYRRYKRLAVSVSEIAIIVLLSAFIGREEFFPGPLRLVHVQTAVESLPLSGAGTNHAPVAAPRTAAPQKPHPQKRTRTAQKTTKLPAAAPVHRSVTIAENHQKQTSGNLELITYPWAMVFIDGKYIGETPRFKTMELSAGRHELYVMNPYLKPYSELIEIKPGSTFTKRINLKE